MQLLHTGTAIVGIAIVGIALVKPSPQQGFTVKWQGLHGVEQETTYSPVIEAAGTKVP